ncbi:hypothetical protein KY320_03575 [Candidatus Woesearchaeota archaeon]|nr:hypothetical protein [Candidatus Woesearchaeota archaeon]
MPESLRDIEERVKRELDTAVSSQQEIVSPFVSGQFRQFQYEEREEHALRSFYEKYCQLASQFMGFFNPHGTMEANLREDISIASLHVEPKGVLAATIFTFLLSFLLTLPFFILGFTDAAFFIISVGLFLSYICFTYPNFNAEITKIRAQQESIMAILYMTIYMRLNPVLENAIYFATQHLNGPLAKDLKNLLWLVDTQKVSSIEEGINMFMDQWILRNKDFVKSLLTLHSILTQQSKEGQERILDKSLNEILSTTYDRMKHYANDMKMPVMILHTFGLMLPLIGLIAFPMLSIFMADSINISYLFFGYIVVLPVLIYFLTRRILSKRPGAFSAPDLSASPYLPPKGKFVINRGEKRYLIPILPISLVLGLIFMLPGIIHLVTATLPAWSEAKSIGSIPAGEYTLAAVLTTTTVPLGLGIGILVYFYLNSVQKIRLREVIQEIEDDLGQAIFQLSNQFTENIPVEVAIENFVKEFEMLKLQKKSIFFFFRDILDIMQDEGITLVRAVFDTARGVLIKYPSVLLKEIMWVIVEGSKKGAKILYNVVTKVSTYLDNTKRIKELIYDLLNETVSSINIQAKFLAPFLAGLVGSLTLIIVQSLYKMMQQLENIMRLLNMLGSDVGGNFFSDFINFTKVTPPTIFQVLVGIYTVETVILLSMLANGVENGFDNAARDMEIAKNLFTALIVYLIVVCIGAMGLKMLVEAGIAAGTIT